MKITMQCECGNRIDLAVARGKYLQLRDNLETHDFRFDGAEIEGKKLKEFRIVCGRCRNFVSLGVE